MSKTLEVIRLGPLCIYPYGLYVAGGVLLGLLYMLFRESRNHLNKGTASWFAVLGIPLALLFSRLGFVLASLDWFESAGTAAVFRITDGGHMFYGALAGLAVAGWITAKLTKQSAARVMDSAAVPSALLIAAARMGEPHVNAGIGRAIEEWFDPFNEMVFFTWEDPSPLYRFPFAVRNYYDEWCFGVFFLEAAVAAIIVLILLMWKTKRPGTKALLFPAMYAGAQAVLESMRADVVLRLGFVRIHDLTLGFVKVNQVLALPILLACVTIAVVRIPRSKMRWWIPVYGYGSILFSCGIIAAMEFALDEKIEILQWMRIDLIFIVMAQVALLMIVSTCRVIQKSDDCPEEPSASLKKA